MHPSGALSAPFCVLTACLLGVASSRNTCMKNGEWLQAILDNDAVLLLRMACGKPPQSKAHLRCASIPLVDLVEGLVVLRHAATCRSSGDNGTKDVYLEIQDSN